MISAVLHRVLIVFQLVLLMTTTDTAVLAQAFEKLDDTTIQTAFDDWKNNVLNVTKYGSIDQWDISQVTALDELFKNTENFNESLTLWDTSNVTSLDDTFRNSINFNADISTWNISSVRSMQCAFCGSENFQSDISAWDTSSLEIMDKTFQDVTKWQPSLHDWDTSKVTTYNRAFERAELNGATNEKICWNLTITEGWSLLYWFCESTGVSFDCNCVPIELEGSINKDCQIRFGVHPLPKCSGTRITPTTVDAPTFAPVTAPASSAVSAVVATAQSFFVSAAMIMTFFV